MRSRLDTFKPEMKNPNKNNNNSANCQLKTNLGVHLAQRLTEQFETFQVFQKMYNSILLERVNRPKAVECSNNNPDNTVQYDDDRDNEHGPDSPAFVLVLDESQELMLAQRSQEIELVLTDVNHVHEILTQIQVMAVEQGSLFDRIDVNLDRTRHNLTRAIGRLEQTATSFSLHQKRLVLLFITLLIFLVALGIFFK